MSKRTLAAEFLIGCPAAHDNLSGIATKVENGGFCSLEEWFDDPDRFERLDEWGLDPLEREALVYYTGYVVGALDASGVHRKGVDVNEVVAAYRDLEAYDRKLDRRTT